MHLTCIGQPLSQNAGERLQYDRSDSYRSPLVKIHQLFFLNGFGYWGYPAAFSTIQDLLVLLLSDPIPGGHPASRHRGLVPWSAPSFSLLLTLPLKQSGCRMGRASSALREKAKLT